MERVDQEYIETLKKHPQGRDYDIEYRIKTKWGYMLLAKLTNKQFNEKIYKRFSR